MSKLSDSLSSVATLEIKNVNKNTSSTNNLLFITAPIYTSVDFILLLGIRFIMIRSGRFTEKSPVFKISSAPQEIMYLRIEFVSGA